MSATTESSSAPDTSEPPRLLAEPLGDSFALDTPRLRLRRPAAGDCDAIHAALRDSLPEFQRWISWCHRRLAREAWEEWIRNAIAGWNESREFPFAMVERATGNVIGATGLNRIDVPGRWANLGYWIRTDRAGRGYATEAAVAVARFGFDVLGLQRIEIFTDVENRASRRVAEKLGATLEGIARNRAPIGSVNHDAAVYSLIPGDALPPLDSST